MMVCIKKEEEKKAQPPKKAYDDNNNECDDDKKNILLLHVAPVMMMIPAAAAASPLPPPLRLPAAAAPAAVDHHDDDNGIMMMINGARWAGAPDARPRRAADRCITVRLDRTLGLSDAAARTVDPLRHNDEARQRMLSAASELRDMRGRWTMLLQGRLNLYRQQKQGPHKQPPLHFTSVSANSVVPKGVVTNLGLYSHVRHHIADLIACLDALRAEQVASGHVNGRRLPWPECLPIGLIEAPGLHAYLDAWAIQSI